MLEPVSDHRERCPEERVGDLRRQVLACAGQHRQFRVPHRAGYAQRWVGLHACETVRDQEGRHLIVDRPMGHKQGARTGVEERAGQSGQAFAGRAPTWPARITGGQDNQVCVQFHLHHLRGRQQRTFRIGCAGWRGSHDRRFALAAEVGGEQRMGGELENPVVLQLRRYDVGGGEIRAQQLIRGGRTEDLPRRVEFLDRVWQNWQT